MKYRMSFVNSRARSPPSAACECTREPAQGTFRLSIEPAPTDVREHATHDETAQLVNAERVQDMFLPSLARVPAHRHGDGYHVHPEQPSSVAHVAQLHDLLDQHDLAARVSLAPGGDETAIAVSLGREDVMELVRNGIVDIAVPLDQGTFRLHSDRPGRITAVEYVRS